jgi:hypothetical protein
MNSHDEERTYYPRHDDAPPHSDRYDERRNAYSQAPPSPHATPVLPAAFLIRMAVAGVIVTIISEVMDKLWR